MYTKVKTLAEIESIRESGHMLASVLKVLKNELAPGQSTKELADIAAKELKALGGEPAFLGYHGFPDVICISVNDEVVHGIPQKTTILQNGDLVGLDFGVKYRDMVTDAAITVIAGNPIDKKHQALLQTTQESLIAGIKQVKDGVQTEDIGSAVQAVLDAHGYGIVRDLVGHGVGHHVHEEPNIPNYGKKGRGERLFAGMTIAIEPMATLGGHKVQVDSDQWTIRTSDGSLAAHFEHTVLITQDSFEILTKV
jgi:methionyl aminopeptidase